MMRYQRVSPDGIPLSNGKKPSLRACKEEDAEINGRTPNYSTHSFDAKPLKPRSANASTTPDHPHFPDPENQPPTASSPFPAPKPFQNHHDTTGNVLLQWGHNKRSRGSRATAADEQPSAPQPRQTIKIQRRSSIATAGAEKLAAASAMPPPGPSYTRGANLRPCTPVRDPTLPLLNRTVEERSGGQTRAEKRSPPPGAEKGIPNGGETEQEAAGEKVNLDHLEWPRIYVSLSRKEKEDDFLAMKGSKLPQRPKKRAKNVDKILQYCFPGMWLSDLTRGRYEVREKKCVKKKRRGLKSMESDSE